MTMEFECSNCGRHFYVYGLIEEAFNKRFVSNLFLRSRGYDVALPSAWKVIQDRAKCCSKPSIHVAMWES